MKLLALVLVLLLRPIWHVKGIGVERFFIGIGRTIANVFPESLPAPMRLAANVVVVPLILAILFLLFDKSLYSLPSFILGLLILVDCLLCRNLDAENSDWLKVWIGKEWQRAYEMIETKRAIAPLDSVSQIHAMYLRIWSEVWLQQVFSTVFWYGLFGPEGAVLYRLALAVAAQSSSDETPTSERELVAFARQFISGMDWLPARLLATTFIFTGNLSYAFSRVLDNWIDYNLTAGEVIAHTAQQATHVEPLPEEHSEQFISVGALQIETLHDVLRRSFLIWVVVFAVLTIVGWVF